MAEPTTAAQFTKAKLVAVQIGKIRTAFDPKWKEVVGKLRAAIKAKQNDKIDLYLSALEGRIKELNKILRAATIARNRGAVRRRIARWRWRASSWPTKRIARWRPTSWKK